LYMDVHLTSAELLHHWSQVEQTMLDVVAKAPTQADRTAAQRRLIIIRRKLAELRELAG
jgi:hypothetical protein